MEFSLSDQLEQCFLVSVTTPEWRESTEKDVEDDTQSPDIHREAITWSEGRRKSGIDCRTLTVRPQNTYTVVLGVITCLREYFWGHISGCSTNGEDGFCDNHGQAKVPQLQPLASTTLTLHLREEEYGGRPEKNGKFTH